jgi:protein-disulfide isomerase
MSPQNEPRPTKAERTAQAREKARLIREAQAKKEKRNSWLIRGGVLVAAVAIVVIVALFIVQAQTNNAPIANSGPVPANANAYGGVVLGKDSAVIAPATTVTSVDRTTLPAAPTAQPTAAFGLSEIGIAAAGKGKPVQVVAYIDFICPHCQAFEATNSAQIQKWQAAGQITMEYRPTGLLDAFTSTNYSSRSAAAAACVVNTAPAKFQSYLNALFAQQPAENSAGLDNSKLISIASDVGAGDISSCVNDKTYRPYVANTTAEAIAHGVTGTPTVFVNGVQDTNTDDFQTTVTAAIAANTAK